MASSGAGLFQVAQRSSFPGWPFLVAGDLAGGQVVECSELECRVIRESLGKSASYVCQDGLIISEFLRFFEVNLLISTQNMIKPTFYCASQSCLWAN